MLLSSQSPTKTQDTTKTKQVYLKKEIKKADKVNRSLDEIIKKQETKKDTIK